MKLLNLSNPEKTVEISQSEVGGKHKTKKKNNLAQLNLLKSQVIFIIVALGTLYQYLILILRF